MRLPQTLPSTRRGKAALEAKPKTWALSRQGA